MAATLLRGRLFAQALDRPLSVFAPRSEVAIVEGDAELTVAGGGDETVTAHGGRVSVRARASGEACDLAAGQRVQVRAKGRLGAEAKAPGGPPAWFVAHREPPMAAVLFEEAFRGWADRPYEERTGTPEVEQEGGRPIALARGAKDPFGFYASAVAFGRSGPGLYRHAAGARLRLRYRLSQPVEIRVQVNSLTQADNFHAVLRRHRRGVFTDVDLPLDAFRDNAGAGKRLEPGAVIGHVAVLAGKPGEEVRLDVARVLIYRAMPGGEKR
jgi:hypothetical protein